MLKKFLLLTLTLATAMGAKASSSISYTAFDKDTKTCVIKKIEASEDTETIEIPATQEYLGDEYKVVEIRANSAKNLPNLKTIIIGANIQTIGNTKVSKMGTNNTADVGDCFNFYGCPKLEKYQVSADNPYFSATGGGILMIKGLQTIVRVPQAMAVTDYTLKMSTSANVLCPGAFAENTTIKKLLLSPRLSFSGEDNSFNDMVNLQEFGVNGTTTPESFTIYQGALFNKDKTTIISFPPAKQTMSYSCPLDVKEIGYKAFANTNLYAVDMSYVYTIGSLAFANSAITSAQIPARTTSVGRYVFMNAPRLSKITVSGEIDIPNYFAQNCPALTEVVLPRKAKSIGRGAFRGCSKLTTFPFDAAIDFSADSIFEGCGFSEVTFTGTFTAAGTANAYRLGRGMFCNNQNLVFLNFRGITLSGDNAMLSIGERMAQGCPNLKRLWLPETTYLNSSYSNYGIFGANPALQQIVLGGFDFERSLPIIRYTSGSYSPTVYMLTTDVTMKKWDLSHFFEPAAGVTCTPTVYCEAYSMLDSDMSSSCSYIYPGGNYYIPGGTQMYDAAKSQVKSLKPMFTMTAANQGGMYTITLSNPIEGLTFGKVYLNGIDCGTVPEDGKVVSEVNAADVRSIDLLYTVNGVAMHTKYPNQLSGIESVEADSEAALTITAAGGTVTFSTEADYTVYDLTGCTAASGKGSCADLTGLSSGMYIVRATAADGTTATAKVRL